MQSLLRSQVRATSAPQIAREHPIYTQNSNTELAAIRAQPLLSPMHLLQTGNRLLITPLNPDERVHSQLLLADTP